MPPFSLTVLPRPLPAWGCVLVRQRLTKFPGLLGVELENFLLWIGVSCLLSIAISSAVLASKTSASQRIWLIRGNCAPDEALWPT